MTGHALDPAVWQALKARAELPPRAPRDALYLAGAQVGSIEPELARSMVAASLPIEAGAESWRIVVPADAIGTEADIASGTDAALARIARWLDDERLGAPWRNELLAVVDAAGVQRGRIERAAVRPLGIETCALHLVGFAEGGGVWLQQRALDKATDPGLWDTLVGGLQAAGESDLLTLEREAWEEAGLRIADLHGLRAAGRIVVRRPVTEGYMVERIEVFTATVPASQVPVNQDGEVACFECLEPRAVLQRIERGQFTLEAALILAEALPRR